MANLINRVNRIRNGEEVYVKPPYDDYGRVYRFFNDNGIKCVTKARRGAQQTISMDAMCVTEALECGLENDISKAQYYAY